MNHYQKITASLSHLIEQYNLHICIKDFCGFIPINKELDEALRPFLAHTNPFCMYIKQDAEKYRDCLRLIRKMYRKCERERSFFYGCCHVGLGEYVVPIACDNMVIGSINIGFFQMDEAQTEGKVYRCCVDSDLLRSDTALDLYHRHISPPLVDIHTVLPIVEMLAEYLGNVYEVFRKTHSVQAPERMHYSSSEDTIITHAVEYIHQHYSTRITVLDIARFCHCSESSLSRIFKKRMTVNINMYINKVRVELSKRMLLQTSAPVTEISLEVGFNDPDYFSCVFTRLMGCPPTEFRRRFREDPFLSAQPRPEV